MFEALTPISFAIHFIRIDFVILFFSFVAMSKAVYVRKILPPRNLKVLDSMNLNQLKGFSVQYAY